MKNDKSMLTEEQKNFFGTKKQNRMGNYTIKYHNNPAYGGILFQIYKGSGKGLSIASSTNWEEIKKFTLADWEYKNIYSKKDERKGGAYFYKGTDILIFTDHPFKKEGFTFKK